MEKITTAAAKTLAEITVMRLTGLSAENLQTIGRLADNSFTILETVGVEFVVLDGQCVGLSDLFNQVMDRIEDAILASVSMPTHFVRGAEVRDDGYGEKTVVVTLHRD
jgi:hypothetical protein